MRQRAFGALPFVVFALVATDARAHAPPEATGILWTSTGGNERTLVRTNRGLIVKDVGQGFVLLCNDAFGASLTEVAPMLATTTGRLYIATYSGGLHAASDDLCTFSSVPGALSKGTNVVDLQRTETSPLFAILSRDGSDDHLLTSTDQGVSWQAPSTVEDFLFSLRVAPSDASRLYASALHSGDGGASSYRLLASSDGGKTFHTTPVALNDSEVGLSVVAVDPSTADRLFVRTVASDPSLPERLLRSDDGGATLVEVHSGLGPTVMGASPDGATLWLGTQEGVYRSTDHGMTFTRLDGAGVTQVACLEYHAGGLYACGLSGNEYGVLQSTDDGVSFSFYLRFPQVTAPLACPMGSTTGDACITRFEDWSLEQGLLKPGNGGTGGVATGGAANGGAANGGAANGGMANAGGTANGGTANGGTANGGVSASGGVSNEHATKSGCSCTAVNASSPSAVWCTVALGIVVASRRRRVHAR